MPLSALIPAPVRTTSFFFIELFIYYFVISTNGRNLISYIYYIMSARVNRIAFLRVAADVAPGDVGAVDDARRSVEGIKAAVFADDGE